MKFIGALFILATTSLLGFEYARRLQERTKQLRLLRTALISLEAEIMFGHAPLHEASRRIARQIANPIGELFDTFADHLIQRDIRAKEAWEFSLQEIWKKTALKKAELDILLQFGENLGRHDLEQQQKQIRLALTHLEREEKEAEEIQKSYGRMYRSLGILAGLLLTLLLV